MTPREPVIVERTDNTLAVVVLAIVIIAILAVTAALVFVNMDVVRDSNGGAVDNPSSPATQAPADDNNILPTVPAVVPEGFLPSFAAV